VAKVTIVFNGQQTELADNATIAEVIKVQGLNPKTVVVELNYAIVKEAEWANAVLKANDILEVLNFVGGG
jgi:sulfur carrier protein